VAPGPRPVLFIIQPRAWRHRWCPLNSHVRPRIEKQRTRPHGSALRPRLRALRNWCSERLASDAMPQLQAVGSVVRSLRLGVRRGCICLLRLQIQRAFRSASARFRGGSAGLAVLVAHWVPTSWPNPSFKRTANGVAPWPRGRVVYHRPRGQGATPLAAA
jgi:hypothetical protein